MINIHSLDHVVLRTTQLGAMLSFYCEVLGCVLERQLDADIGLTQLRAGEALIDLVDVDSTIGRSGGLSPDPERNNMDHFCLLLEEFDAHAIRQHLAVHHISAGAVKNRYGAQGDGPSLYIRDPDGNTIELKGRQDHTHSLEMRSDMT